MNTTTPLKPRVIFLNGPKQSGKDTIGEILAERCKHIHLLKFAQPLIGGMQAVFGVSCADGKDKEEPTPDLMGFSRRQIAIDLSENWFKEKFGQEVFGEIALNKLQRIHPSKTIVFTDSGFLCEAQPILRLFMPKTTDIVKLSRPGHDFEGDSRSYWADDRTIRRRIFNDGTIDDLELQVESLLETWSL